MIDDLSPNFWKARTRTDCLVLHYTANESLSEAVSLMRARGVSVHYIVGTDGEVRRLVHEKLPRLARRRQRVEWPRRRQSILDRRAFSTRHGNLSKA